MQLQSTAVHVLTLILKKAFFPLAFIKQSSCWDIIEGI